MRQARWDTRGVRTQGEDLGIGDTAGATAAVDLYWLPLGAGGHFVRLNGRVYEALASWIAEAAGLRPLSLRAPDRSPGGTFVIEQAPVPDLSGEQRGVVAEGPVGSRWAGRFRIFRYEIRLWRDGNIPDIAEAVDSPRRLTDDEIAPARARPDREDPDSRVGSR